jgi:hypothetical protein
MGWRIVTDGHWLQTKGCGNIIGRFVILRPSLDDEGGVECCQRLAEAVIAELKIEMESWMWVSLRGSEKV